MSSPETEAAGRRARSQLDTQRDGGIREEAGRSVQSQDRVYSSGLAQSKIFTRSHRETSSPPVLAPLPTESSSKITGQSGRPLWFFSMEPFPGLPVCGRCCQRPESLCRVGCEARALPRFHAQAS